MGFKRQVKQDFTLFFQKIVGTFFLIFIVEHTESTVKTAQP